MIFIKYFIDIYKKQVEFENRCLRTCTYIKGVITIDICYNKQAVYSLYNNYNYDT